MNKFVKYFVLPFSILGATAGITGGTTYAVTKHQDNKQIEIARQEGYQNALTDNAFYKEQIAIYESLVAEQNKTINDFVAKVSNLNVKNQQIETQLATTRSQLETANSRINAVESDNAEKTTIITSLESEKAVLETRVTELEQSDGDKSAELAALKIQISNLQAQITALQTTVQLNTGTINSLNMQISNYQTQIANLRTELLNNQTSIKAYTDKISQLEKTISYLESYLAINIKENQSIVKFTFDGSLYNAQIVTNGNSPAVADPASTEYVIFNYWMKDNVQVNPNEIIINGNTEFVANITRKYDVVYSADSIEISKQIVIENGHSILPGTTPTKEGYAFLGYSLDGVNIVEDPTSVAITSDTIFTAMFAKLHTVKFNDGTNEMSQTVKDGETLTVPEDPIKPGYEFDYWEINGVRADPNGYAVTSDITFTAHFTALHTVTFDDGINEPQAQTVRFGECATIPISPTKDGYKFDGWTIDGENVIDVSTYSIVSNTTFIAHYTINKQWHTIFEGSKVALNNTSPFEFSKPLNISVEGLKTTDKIKVTFSFVATADEVDAGYPLYYWTGEDFEYVSLSSNPATGNLIVDENGFTSPSSFSGYTPSLSISCNTDGVLTITGTSGSMDVNFVKLTIAKIEVYK